MKKIHQLILLGMAVSMILNSCSVEKRVYRPGFHIEWNQSKNNRNLPDESFKETGQVAEQAQNASEISSENKMGSQNNSAHDFKNTHSNEADKIIESSSSEKNVVVKNEPISNAPAHSFSETDVKLSTQKNNSVKNEFNPTNEFGGGKSGWFMLIMGLILIGIGFLFQSFLGVFGLILFIIFGIGGAIYFIAGVIILIVNA